MSRNERWDTYAAAALQSLVGQYFYTYGPEQLAVFAATQADAMMAEVDRRAAAARRAEGAK